MRSLKRFLASLVLPELRELRVTFAELNLEPCYLRYIERLAVVHASLFLFITELLAFSHLTLQVAFGGCTLWTTMPFVITIVISPFILIICFKDRKKYKRFRLWNILASCAASILIAVLDTFVISFTAGSIQHLRSSYDHVVIVGVYILLPISIYGKPMLLGFGIALIYFTYYIYSSLMHQGDVNLSTHGSYAIYLISLNMFMKGFTIFFEYKLRRMILNRRQLLYNNFKLRAVVLKEKDIMERVLPSIIRDTLKEDMYKHIEMQQMGMRYLVSTLLFIELYSNISILIANVINFQLITRLELPDIIDTLNKLCVQLDNLATKHNVLIIKFVGNALSCVSGFEPNTTRHANACIDVALELIDIINEVGQSKDLDFGVRIAVHNGEAFTAIVGRKKCCFDIWSRDVAITHCLESLGRTNMVHVSQKTLSSLHSEYIYEEGPTEAKTSSFLQKLGIKTYLIGPQSRVIQSKIGHFYMDVSAKSKSGSDISSVPTSIFWNKNDSQFSVSSAESDPDGLQQKTANCMLEKVERMPVDSIHLARFFDFSNRIERGNEDYVIKPYITPFWRIYRDPEIESGYKNQPDPLFKYALLIIEFVNTSFWIIILFPPNLPVAYWMGFADLLLILICLIGFYRKIAKCQSKFFLHNWLWTFSRWMEEKIVVRAIIHVFCIAMVYLMAVLETVRLRMLNLKDIQNIKDHVHVMEPWEASEHMILIFMLFTFLTVPLIFKATLISLICIVHLIIMYVFIRIDSKFQTNMGLPADVAGIWYLLSASIFYLIMDHHIIYLQRVSYYFLLNVSKKQAQMKKSDENSKMLLSNILPSYLVPIYMNHPSNEHPHREIVSKVAVLFAAIVNFPLDTTSLRVLNEYICYFDDLTEEYAKAFKVEKIKVINWTYVAACGLDSGYIPTQVSGISLKKPVRARVSKLSIISDDSVQMPKFMDYNPRFSHPLLEYDDYCLLYLVHYAADMLRIMQDIAMQNLTMKFPNAMPGQLKIGISHGPVYAGVVGQSRFYFDLWGRTVNVAAIMAAKGVTNQIHVTGNTAEKLNQFDIKCDFRGVENDKYEGTISTYLVELDNVLNFEGVDDNYVQEVRDQERNHQSFMYDRKEDYNSGRKSKQQ